MPRVVDATSSQPTRRFRVRTRVSAPATVGASANNMKSTSADVCRLAVAAPFRRSTTTVATVLTATQARHAERTRCPLIPPRGSTQP